LEIKMSVLRPRDIQARIRSGESPEAVATAAQTTVDKIMGFATPVLAERAYVAQQAQKASVRRRAADGPIGHLGEAVNQRLTSSDADPEAVEWDAWRREDGRWAVRVSYFVESENEAEQKDEKVAMFAYDAPGRYAVPDDDEARWLVGEQAQVMPTPSQPEPGQRRLSAVADIDPTLAPDHGADSYEAGFEDTVQLRRRNHPAPPEEPRQFTRETSREPGPRRVHSVPNPDEEPTLIDVPVDQPPAPRPAVRAVERPADPPAFASPATPRETPRETPVEARRPEPAPEPARAPEPVRPEPVRAPEPAQEAPAVEEPVAADEPAAESAPEEPKKKPARRGKRASVPSWDEIMFGKKAD
jgi:hypothetical protein